MDKICIIDTSRENIGQYAMCGYKDPKNRGYQHKINWVKERFSEGLRYKILESEEKGAVGAIEYLPGQYAWRPVKAHNYMFIHCIYIMSKKYKGLGYGAKMLDECIRDSRESGMSGVAVVVRKGSWMAKEALFLKAGFIEYDRTGPDFKLLALKFNENAPDPFFTVDQDLPDNINDGLTIITSAQCPYTYKAVTEISETAVQEFKLNPNIIQLEDAQEAQHTPGAFGTFMILYDGKVVADHPVSNTRFRNIMKSLLSTPSLSYSFSSLRTSLTAPTKKDRSIVLLPLVVASF